MLDIFSCACSISLEKWRSDHFYEAILCPQDDTLERKGWRGSDLLPQRKFHHFTFTTYLFFPKELSCSPLWINNIWKFLCVMRIKKGHHIVSMCHFSPLSSPPPPRSPNSWVSFQESECANFFPELPLHRDWGEGGWVEETGMNGKMIQTIVIYWLKGRRNRS